MKLLDRARLGLYVQRYDFWLDVADVRRRRRRARCGTSCAPTCTTPRTTWAPPWRWPGLGSPRDAGPRDRRRGTPAARHGRTGPQARSGRWRPSWCSCCCGRSRCSRSSTACRPPVRRARDRLGLPVGRHRRGAGRPGLEVSASVPVAVVGADPRRLRRRLPGRGCSDPPRPRARSGERRVPPRLAESYDDRARAGDAVGGRPSRPRSRRRCATGDRRARPRRAPGGRRGRRGTAPPPSPAARRPRRRPPGR